MTTPRNGPERDVRAPATNKAGRYRETREYVGFVRRSIRGLTKRVGADADIESLAEMLDLAKAMGDAVQTAVTQLRLSGYSWDEIADRVGATRQTVWERWRDPDVEATVKARRADERAAARKPPPPTLRKTGPGVYRSTAGHHAVVQDDGRWKLTHPSGNEWVIVDRLDAARQFLRTNPAWGQATADA